MTLAVHGYTLWLTCGDGLPVVVVVTLAVHRYMLWLTDSWRFSCGSDGDAGYTRVHAVTDLWRFTCGSGGDVGCTQVYAVTDWLVTAYLW